MPVHVLINLTAEDRPGLVETLSDRVTHHGGNWIDSSMARLGGEFAGIVRVSLPDAAISAFEQDLKNLVAEGITALVRRTDTSAAPKGRSARLDLTGADHPGIVHQISSALAEQGVSFDELHTQVVPGSMSGAPVFVAKGRLVLPDDVSIDQIRDRLEAIAQDIMVDVSLNPVG
ncbi:MAG: ACT domain-containing protein [Pseudomonadota bacterium]